MCTLLVAGAFFFVSGVVAYWPMVPRRSDRTAEAEREGFVTRGRRKVEEEEEDSVRRKCVSRLSDDYRKCATRPRCWDGVLIFRVGKDRLERIAMSGRRSGNDQKESGVCKSGA